jgi:inner membrane protein
MGKLINGKLFTLVVLALILAFALSQVEWKLRERQATRDGAVKSIAEQYAREQQLVGPLLWVRCREPREQVETDDKGVSRTRRVNHDCSTTLRPTQLTGQGGLEVSERYRGIYKGRVYLAALRMQARLPGYTPKPGQNIEGAYLIFGVTDPRGLKRIRVIGGLGEDLPAKPGTLGMIVENGFHVPLDPATLTQGMDLNLELEVAGSGRFDWAPVAEQNDFNLASAWPHPSFVGGFLPETREVGAQGFKSRWRVNDFATGGDRILTGRPDRETGMQRIATTLGVSLLDPVDAYTQADRAVRYGFLFILQTLGGFFLFELLKKRMLHPLQYLLVGFAVVIFFLLLLALSEHIAFNLAYLVAAGACVLLTGAYGRVLLGSWRGAVVLGSGYAVLYAGLYQLLASEDYALLMGAWLIFGILALTMYLTRRLDWGGLNAPLSSSRPE